MYCSRYSVPSQFKEIISLQEEPSGDYKVMLVGSTQGDPTKYGTIYNT